MNLEEKLTRHFLDDEKSFGDLRLGLERMNELMRLNGEHLSHIRKDMNEMNSTFLQHTVRVEPMLKAFQDRKTVRIAVTSTGRTIFMWAGGLGLIAVAWTYIKPVILWLFKS